MDNNESKPETQSDQVRIHKNEPVTIAAGQQVVYFRRKKVSEADSFRGVAVPQFTETQQLPSPLPEQFVVAIREAVEAAASDILRSYVDANPHAVSISGKMLSFSAVLDQLQASQTSQRLNGDQIGSWYDGSETAKAAAVRYGSEEAGLRKQQTLRSKYISLASNNPAVDVTLATKMLSYLSEADTNSSICKAVASRLERLSKADTSEDL